MYLLERKARNAIMLQIGRTELQTFQYYSLHIHAWLIHTFGLPNKDAYAVSSATVALPAHLNWSSNK
jgi:hypothetical protein